ncbi:dNTP triphosphohydrolase [Sinorhizobium medicae]|nr:dNTP triphosphohydrolase [Sinorhizobium medicae]
MVNWENRHHEDKPADHRTNFERDYARIVHSASFRRLQSKTQVLGVGEADFYRTRLTHTLEVSQIGVSITKKLYREAKKAEETEKTAILPEPMLMSSICLAHDLGHPPFGHGGEVALNRCMLRYGGFEGNGQTLRIITRLEPYHEKGGMNLTRRTVLGTIKYPVPYSGVVDWGLEGLGGKPDDAPAEIFDTRYETDIPKSSIFVADHFKPPKCYLDTEHESVVVSWVREGLEEDWNKLSMVFPTKPGKHPKSKFMSLDTSIMELADDIAYGVHDLEDAISLKLIDIERFFDWLGGNDDDTGKKRKELLKPYLDENHEGSLQNFGHELFRKGSRHRKHEISMLVGYFVERCTMVKDSELGFTSDIFRWKAALPECYSNAMRVLKGLVADLVVKTPQVQQLEFKGQKIVTELFGAFATDPKRLLDPRDFKKTIQGGGDTPTPRVICDYIAGMTDEYATKRYQQLFEPRVGSVFDRL